MKRPTDCQYAPPGEYIKDHSFVFHDGWWHLFSISGTAGYYHGYNGNEETISWSIGKNLVDWEMRGHVLHASQWENSFDQHEVWAPFCLKANDGFYLFYTGIIHPNRPLEYRKLGHDHPFIHLGHKETQGLAFSTDLTDWEKVSDFSYGLRIPGRDSHVVWDAAGKRWLLYSTGRKKDGLSEAFVSESQNLRQWNLLGTCARFPEPDPANILGDTAKGLTTGGAKEWGCTTESLFVMKHPLDDRWIMLANWQYALSDDPTDFTKCAPRAYDLRFNGVVTDIGFAGEILQYGGKWYRSGVIGARDYWKLGFTEIEWERGGAFKIASPSACPRS